MILFCFVNFHSATETYEDYDHTKVYDSYFLAQSDTFAPVTNTKTKSLCDQILDAEIESFINLIPDIFTWQLVDLKTDTVREQICDLNCKTFSIFLNQETQSKFDSISDLSDTEIDMSSAELTKQSRVHTTDQNLKSFFDKEPNSAVLEIWSILTWICLTPVPL